MMAGYYDWKRGMTVEEVVRRWQEGWEKVYDRSMPAMVPVKVLWPLREYTWTRDTARDGGEYWDNLKASMSSKGWNPDEPLHLDIGRLGGVKVGEGNHRLAISRAAGVREVPVWFHFITTQVRKNPQHSLARSMPEPPPKPRPAPSSKPLPPDPERDKYVDDIMRILDPSYRGESAMPRGVVLVEADARIRELERTFHETAALTDMLNLRFARTRAGLRAYTATMASVVDKPLIVHSNGRLQRVTNLGWLLKNWRDVERIVVDVFTDRAAEVAWKPGEAWVGRPHKDAVLRVLMQDGRWYETSFASQDHLWDWLNRPSFRGTDLDWNGFQTIAGGPRPPHVRAYKSHEVEKHPSGVGYRRVR